MVRRALTDYAEEGKIRRGFLGVSLRSDLNQNGAMVGSVVSGSAADKAGFLPGDKIIGWEISRSYQLTRQGLLFLKLNQDQKSRLKSFAMINL